MEIFCCIAFRRVAQALGVSWAGFSAVFFLVVGATLDAHADLAKPLRVAVYQVEPYGGQDRNGMFVGASVDLWRRVAGYLNWQYQLIPVSQMDAVLSGLETGTYDVAIGAITITPERLARVDFSYPTHRSGVAVVFSKQVGVASALHEYGAAVGELGALFVPIVILLLVIGLLMWWFERPYLNKTGGTGSESAVTKWHEGVYWAVVTMTTVGYGDKTPKSHAGRTLAVVWMVASLVLVSLLTTNLVARMTVSRVEGIGETRAGDLVGKRLAAVSASSGAEYLDDQHLPYEKFSDLPAALNALAAGKADAVVNSVGALRYLVNTRFSDAIAPPRGLLAPAYMGFALPMNSELKKPLDRALTAATGSPEWQLVEETYFGR
jgi:polar amino acid transport system substrate-binding protein